MTPANEAKLRAKILRDVERAGQPFALTKPELLATITAIDDHLEASQAALFATLPTPAQAMTAAGKRNLVSLVVEFRAKG